MGTIRTSIRHDSYYLIKGVIKEVLDSKDFYDEMNLKDFALLLIHKCNGHISRIEKKNERS